MKFAKEYLLWDKSHPIPKIPIDVAATGAGSEGRMPFTHYANVMPVYLFAGKIINYQLSNFNPKHAVRVLDHGCGTGRPLAFLAQLFPKIKFTGIDQSQACISYAQKHYTSKNLKFEIDNSQFAIRNSQFDLTISSHVLEHVPKKDVTNFFNSLKSSLKPKTGILVIGTPNRAWLQDLYIKNPQDLPLRRLVLPHEHEYTYKELKKLLFSEFNKIKIYGLKNSKNATFSKHSIKNARPKFLTPEIFNIVRQIIPKNIVDYLGKRSTEQILTYLDITYDELLTTNKDILNYPRGLNFIALCCDPKP